MWESLLLFETIISIKELLENFTCYHFLPEKEERLREVCDNSKSLGRWRLLSCDITVPGTTVANSMGVTPYAISFPLWVSSHLLLPLCSDEIHAPFLLQKFFSLTIFSLRHIRKTQHNETKSLWIKQAHI